MVQVEHQVKMVLKVQMEQQDNQAQTEQMVLQVKMVQQDIME